MFCFIFLFAGDMMIQALGGHESMPDLIKDFHDYVKENKMQFGGAVFLIGSIVQA